MPEYGNGILRVGSYSVDAATVDRLVARYGSEALRLPATGAPAVRWALRQATLRALAAPPRIACRWGDIALRGEDEGPWTLLFKGEVAPYARSVLHGDVSLSVTTRAGRVTAHAVLTRAASPSAPRETEVPR
ncbi:hypothetical protein EDE04_7300 [Streptomyces sp. 2132.2]|uniref:hypothetical protein n=1 Tax=Streptomyces sp. 2132.2 TaxID=2485161 RepID=UPI000C175942|nr:hypothetical protein [Streptomyces sp. 2132.2]ROQ88908.1 hypothetical protein EDE04_7300 [Streptomyces sp. 2132.2]